MESLRPNSRAKLHQHWNRRTGEPVLIQRDAIAKGTRKPPTQEEVLRALKEPVTTGAAAEFGYPIGFCVMTGPEVLVIVDLDNTDKNHELIARASRDRHYIEKTPSGGLHVVVQADDDMASWAKQTTKRQNQLLHQVVSWSPTVSTAVRCCLSEKSA